MNAIYLKTKWFFYFLGLLMVSSIFMVKAMANSDKADLVTLAQEGNLPELKRQIAQGENIEQRDIKLRKPPLRRFLRINRLINLQQPFLLSYVSHRIRHDQ